MTLSKSPHVTQNNCVIVSGSYKTWTGSWTGMESGLEWNLELAHARYFYCFHVAFWFLLYVMEMESEIIVLSSSESSNGDDVDGGIKYGH